MKNKKIVLGAAGVAAILVAGVIGCQDRHTLKGETVEVDMTQDNNFTFSDNQILAIGYVNDFNEEEFIRQNFVSRDKYDMLSVYDFRAEENREEETENKFVFFPKTTDVKLTFYRCHADENGELKLDDCLLSNTIGNFMVIDDYLAESTTPEVAVKLCYHGYEDIIPISFSGMDGTLALTGHEGEVRDVTVY